jgi:hypothetical protein
VLVSVFSSLVQVIDFSIGISQPYAISHSEIIMKMLQYLFSIILGLSFSGVSLAQNVPFSLEGKVVYLAMEGGFYGIVSTEGRKYLATNLPRMLQQTNLAVRGKAVLQPNMMGIHQWGEYIQLLDISPRCPLQRSE